MSQRVRSDPLVVIAIAYMPMPSAPNTQPQIAAAPVVPAAEEQPSTEPTPPTIEDKEAGAQRAKQELELAEQRKLEAEARERELRILKERAEANLKAIAALDYRGWSSKDGKFNVTADLIRINETTVTIKRIDNDKEIEVPLEKLSDADNEYVNSLR